MAWALFATVAEASGIAEEEPDETIDQLVPAVERLDETVNQLVPTVNQLVPAVERLDKAVGQLSGLSNDVRDIRTALNDSTIASANWIIGLYGSLIGVLVGVAGMIGFQFLKRSRT